MTVRIEIPMALPSAGNLHEHWRKRHQRIKLQRAATRFAMAGHAMTLAKAGAHAHGANLTVTLTRVSPRQLDDDNLAFAFKGVRDEVAACFGVNDNDPRIEWHYAQRKGPAAVVLEFDVRTVAVVDPGPEAVAE